MFSLTKKDFVIETFRCGGHGGQNVNKLETGVRIRHPASGAVAECREERKQLQNKKKAFERLVKSPEFQKWHKIESARAMGKFKDIEQQVDEWVKEENLKIEVQVDGRWREMGQVND